MLHRRLLIKDRTLKTGMSNISNVGYVIYVLCKRHDECHHAHSFECKFSKRFRGQCDLGCGLCKDVFNSHMTIIVQQLI